MEPIVDFCDCYVDDFATYSVGFVTHLEHVRKFLEVMRASGLTLKLGKSHFALPEVSFVGHVMDRENMGLIQTKCHV